MQMVVTTLFVSAFVSVPAHLQERLRNYGIWAENPIEVSTTEELANAIDSNTCIFLKDGDYVLREIRHVKNLTIAAMGNARILSHDAYGDVLTVRESERLSLFGLEIGHAPEVEYCTGGALAIRTSKSIVIAETRLFGSGTTGLSLADVKDLTLVDARIDGCTQSIITSFDSTNVKVRKTTMENNVGGIRSVSSSIYIGESEILDNEVEDEFFSIDSTALPASRGFVVLDETDVDLPLNAKLTNAPDMLWLKEDIEYFGLDSSGTKSVLRVAVHEDHLPLLRTINDAMIGVDAVAVIGLDAEIARELARLLGREVRFVRSSKRDPWLDVAAGKADIALSGISPIPERAQHVDFTEPYLELAYTIAHRANRIVGANENLSRWHIAAPRGAAQAAAAQLLPDSTIVAVKDLSEGQRLLEAAKVDAVFFDDVGLKRLSAESGLQIWSVRLGESPIAMAVPKGQAARWNRMLEKVDLGALVERWYQPAAKYLPVYFARCDGNSMNVEARFSPDAGLTRVQSVDLNIAEARWYSGSERVARLKYSADGDQLNLGACNGLSVAASAPLVSGREPEPEIRRVVAGTLGEENNFCPGEEVEKVHAMRLSDRAGGHWVTWLGTEISCSRCADDSDGPCGSWEYSDTTWRVVTPAGVEHRFTAVLNSQGC